MSSASAAEVVRRRSVNSCDADTLQSGMRKGSRHGDARVKINRLRSSGDTLVAPEKVSVVTVTESCDARGGNALCARAFPMQSTTNDAAMTRR